MEHARNGIERVEAELYMDEALRIFPEDGYFLKYKGELQWMLGKCADALEIFADAREHTDNQVVLHELDQFLTPYCKGNRQYLSDASGRRTKRRGKEAD